MAGLGEADGWREYGLGAADADGWRESEGWWLDDAGVWTWYSWWNGEWWQWSRATSWTPWAPTPAPPVDDDVMADDADDEELIRAFKRLRHF
jgi:hypothetical protein